MYSYVKDVDIRLVRSWCMEGDGHDTPRPSDLDLQIQMSRLAIERVL
jgi:hypothetical protein